MFELILGGAPLGSQFVCRRVSAGGRWPMRPDQSLGPPPSSRGVVRRAGSVACRQSGQAHRPARLWIDVVKLTGPDQAIYGCRAYAATIRTTEEPGFSAQTDTSERSLSRVIRQTDPTIFEEAGEQLPSLQAYSPSPWPPGNGATVCALSLHPVLQIGQNRGAQFLAYPKPSLGRRAIDFSLDVEQNVDPLHRLQRHRRDRCRVLATPLAGRDVGEFEKLAPGVAPTSRLGDAPRHIEAVVAGVDVGLEDAAEGLQMFNRMLAAPVPRIAEQTAGGSLPPNGLSSRT